MGFINIIYSENGAGLSKDAKILAKLFKKHNINFIDFNNPKNFPKADFNIFLQNFGYKGSLLMELAKINILIPNQEWLTRIDLELTRQCDLILCKTKYALKLLEPYNNNRFFTGFASEDLFFPCYKHKKLLHFKGLSSQKYTESVINNDNVIIFDAKREFKKSNCINRYLSESEKMQIFNSYGYHICPSLNEGWGHYVYEALGCGAHVVLSDIAPFEDIPRELVTTIPAQKNTNNSIIFSNKLNQLVFPLRESFFIDKTQLDIITKFLDQPKFNGQSREFFLENNYKFERNINKFLS